MSPFRRFWNILRRSRLDEDLRQELETHLGLIEEEERTEGSTAEDARRRARVRFGNPVAYRERALETVVATWFEDAVMDVRFAIRQLRKARAFTLVSMLLTALAVGTTTTLFSLTYGVLLKPLPWPESDRLVRIEETRGGHPGVVPWTISNATYLAWRDRPSTIVEIGGWQRGRLMTMAGANACDVSTADRTPL